MNIMNQTIDVYRNKVRVKQRLYFHLKERNNFEEFSFSFSENYPGKSHKDVIDSRGTSRKSQYYFL